MWKWIVLLFVMNITTVGTSQDSLDWVIKPQYESATSFSEGLASIETNSMNYIIINTNGDTLFLIEDIEYITEFSEHIAAIYRNYTYRYIDTTGKIIIPQRFDKISKFKNGIVMVERDGFCGAINTKGQIILPFQYHLAGSFAEDKCKVGIYNMEIKREEYENPSKLFGFIDKSGKQIVDFIYDDADDFSEGLAWVKKKNKVGYIDKQGTVVIPFQFKWAYAFSEGLASVCYNMMDITAEIKKEDIKYSSIDEPQKVEKLRYFFIDKKGMIVIPHQFLNAQRFSEGLAAVKDTTGFWGFIDKVGNWVIKPQYRAANSFSEGLAAVQTKDRWGFIDTANRLIIPMVLIDVSESSEGFIAARLTYNKGWGYLRNPLYKRKE